MMVVSCMLTFLDYLKVSQHTELISWHLIQPAKSLPHKRIWAFFSETGRGQVKFISLPKK